MQPSLQCVLEALLQVIKQSGCEADHARHPVPMLIIGGDITLLHPPPHVFNEYIRAILAFTLNSPPTNGMFKRNIYNIIWSIPDGVTLKCTLLVHSIFLYSYTAFQNFLRPQRILFGWSNREEWDERGMWRVVDRRGVYRIWCRNLRERNHFKDLGVDARIILRRIFTKWVVGGGAWPGSIWITKRTDGDML